MHQSKKRQRIPQAHPHLTLFPIKDPIPLQLLNNNLLKEDFILLRGRSLMWTWNQSFLMHQLSLPFL
jgi:hypothetical protein